MQQQPCVETLIRKGGKQAEGTHKTKALLNCNNRRASAADKKVAGLPTPGSLIKRDNCSLAAWPLGITGTYS